MKIDKIENEMQKTREKITDLQNRLKELDAQRTEQENLQIVALVRSLNIPRGDLKAFLQEAAGQTAPVSYPAAAYTTTEQEDSEDEE